MKKVLNKLDRIVAVCQKHKLPPDQILFMHEKEYNETLKALKNFGSNGCIEATLPNSITIVPLFRYCLYNLYFVKY